MLKTSHGIVFAEPVPGKILQFISYVGAGKKENYESGPSSGHARLGSSFER